MATIDELNVRITADSSKLASEVDKADKKVSGFAKGAEKSAKALSTGMLVMGTAVGNVLGSIISKAFQSINAHMDDSIKRLDTLNNYTRVMTNLGVAAQDSEKSLKVLDNGITGLPTRLDDAASAVQRFTAANGNIAASTDMFLALNNAILAGGAATETQNTALEQMMQAYSKGKPDAMEWRAFLTAMPAQLKQIATSMGYTSSAMGGDLYNALQTGKISMNDFMFAIMKLNKQGVAGFESFATQARNATSGVGTSITNLKTAITRGITQILDVLGQSNIAGFFNGLSKAISTAFNYVAAFVKIIKEAVAWIGALFGGSGSTSGLVKETSGVTSNLESASSGAANTASGLDDAAKSAKKLKNQLAGFDEMNVLNAPDASGGSGSGGSDGGGNAAISDYTWDSSFVDDATSKIDALVAKIKQAFNDIFGEWDFDKIGKSLKRFYDDVKKFIGNAGKIFNDVWQKYLRPFLQWSGESLLPSVLNAIGGAIRLLGEIIRNVWDTFLMPFIDAFLVPIAQFTGGIIVSVLNGIGDALRGIANNSAAVETISLLTKGFITLIGLNLVAGFFTGLINAITGGKIAMSGFLGVLSKTTGSWDLFNKAGATGSGIINSLKDGAASLVGKISALGAPLADFANTLGGKVVTAITGAKTASVGLFSAFGAGIVVMEAVVAVILAIQTAMEFAKLKTMEAELAELQYKSTEESMTETTNWHNESIQRQVDLKKELEGITKTLADAQLALLSAQDAVATSQSNAEQIARQYGMTIEEARAYVAGLDTASGNLTEKDRILAGAVFDLDSKEGSLKEAIDKVAAAKDEQSVATENLSNQQWKEVMSQQQAEAEALLAAGKYDELRQKIVDLANSNGEFTLENGENCKINKEDMEGMADFISRQLADIDDDNGKAWNSIWQSADRTVSNLNGKVKNDLSSGGRTAGANWAEGVGQGAQSKRGWLSSTIGSIGSSMLGVFKNQFDIHSPSKVMAQMGSYIMQGVGIGMEGEEKNLTKTMSGIGESIQDSFSSATADIPTMLSDISAPTVDLPDISRAVQHRIDGELSVEKQPISLTAILKIDGENVPVSLEFAQNMANSINELSQMKNRSIIDI